ncbi:MAG TPA: 2-oxoglutarate and iron-dependent oxygenase domain-containing protein [Acetobacteraceae bacterium]
MDRVPSIDLTPFRLGTDRQPIIDAVRAACEQIGFLVISGHGIDQPLLAEAFAQSRAFFDQPLSDKRRAAPPIARRQRGYHEIASRNLGKTMGADVPPDLRESFFFGPIDDHRAHYADMPEATESYAPNVLPDAPPGFTPTMIALYRSFEHLSQDLLRIFACALQLPELWFADKIDRHFSIMSTHHYPPLTEQPRPGQLRTGAHTDFGAMTILAMTDAAGGLEVLLPDGTWSSVVAGPQQLVVNLGDMMARWTNRRWASTVHRVVNPPVINLAESRRQSIGYFMHPNDDAPIACIPTCRAENNPPWFPETTAGRHIRKKIAQSHKAA